MEHPAKAAEPSRGNYGRVHSSRAQYERTVSYAGRGRIVGPDGTFWRVAYVPCNGAAERPLWLVPSQFHASQLEPGQTGHIVLIAHGGGEALPHMYLDLMPLPDEISAVIGKACQLPETHQTETVS